MDFINFNSVETLPGFEARAAFTVNSASVFKEDVDIAPTIVDLQGEVPHDGGKSSRTTFALAITLVRKKIANFALIIRSRSDNDLLTAKTYGDSRKNFENS